MNQKNHQNHAVVLVAHIWPSKRLPTPNTLWCRTAKLTRANRQSCCTKRSSEPEALAEKPATSAAACGNIPANRVRSGMPTGETRVGQRDGKPPVGRAFKRCPATLFPSTFSAQSHEPACPDAPSDPAHHREQQSLHRRSDDGHQPNAAVDPRMLPCR